MAVSEMGANNAQRAMGWIAFMTIGIIGARDRHLPLTRRVNAGVHLHHFGNEEPLLAPRAGTARQAAVVSAR